MQERLRHTADALQPPRLMETLADYLAAPEESLRLEPIKLCVDRAGIIVSSDDKPANADTLRFVELTSRDQRRWVVMIVQVTARRRAPPSSASKKRGATSFSDAPPPQPRPHPAAVLDRAAGCRAEHRYEERLPAPVARALKAAGIPQAAVGVVVQETGAVFPRVSVNAGLTMNPASVMKLVTTFAALELLGPAYAWKTEALVAAPPSTACSPATSTSRAAATPS